MCPLPPASVPPSRTHRASGVFARVTDRYHQTVTVQASSLATEACVWIFTDKPSAKYAAFTLDQPTPHLTVSQAQRVIAGLQEFVAANT